MLSLLLVFCVLGLSSVQASITIDSTNVVEMVDSAVNPILVLYGADPAVDQDDTFEKFSERIVSNGVSVGRVDCTNKKSRKLCQNFASQLPQIALYVGEPELNPYTKKYFRKPQAFAGTLNEKDIERFIAKNLPNKLTSYGSIGELLNSTYTNKEKLPSALFVSKKDTVPALIKVLSGYYHGRLQLVHVKPTSNPVECEICTTFNINKPGTALGMVLVSTDVISNVKLTPGKLLDDAVTQGLDWFDGDLKNRDQLTAYLDRYALPSPHPSFASGTSPSTKTKASASNLDDPLDDENPNKNEVFSEQSLASVADLSTNFAWIVGVTGKEAASSDIAHWSTSIHRLAEGMVRVAEVHCNQSAVEEPTVTFGQLLCRSGKKLPYVQVIPYEGVDISSTDYTSDRRKMLFTSSSDSHSTAAAAVIKYAVRVPYYQTGKGEANEKELVNAVKEIKKLAMESIPESEVSVITENDMQNYIRDGYVGGGRQTLSIIMLTSGVNNDGGSGTVPTTFRNFALSLKQYYNVQVAMIPAPSASYLASVGNPILPSMLVLYPVAEDASATASDSANSKTKKNANPNDEVKFQLALYDRAQLGPMKFMTMLQFAMSVYAQVGVKSLDQDRSQSTSPSRNTVSIPKIIDVRSQEQWEQECGAEFRGLCAISVFDYSPVDDSVVNSHIATWAAVQNTLFKESATADALQAYKFVRVDGSCQHEFLEGQFGLSNLYYNLPAVLVYSSAKQRFVQYGGSFNENEVKNFLLSVITGSTSTSPITTSTTNIKPSFLTVDQCRDRTETTRAAVAQSLTSVDGDGLDMSDFLEELRLEEESKQRQLQAELEAEAIQRQKDAEAAAELVKQEEANKAAGTPVRRKIKRVVKKKDKA